MDHFNPFILDLSGFRACTQSAVPCAELRGKCASNVCSAGRTAGTAVSSAPVPAWSAGMCDADRYSQWMHAATV